MSRNIAGIHAVKHALEAGEPVSELLVERGKKHPRINELIHLAKKAKIHVSFLPKAAMDRLADGAQHQGVVARAWARQKLALDEWLAGLDMAEKPIVLVLDGVTDPHNLGACIRTAEAAGCCGVVIPKDNAADLHSAVVAKAACGAISLIPVLTVTNLVRAMKQLQQAGFWLSGLAGEAESLLFDYDMKGAAGLVLGGEGKGLRRLVREQCDDLVKIPMPGNMESLNVSVAAGVALFELVRKKTTA